MRRDGHCRYGCDSAVHRCGRGDRIAVPCFEIEAGEGTTLEQEAGVAVLDREREAGAAIARLEFTLEVGGPDIVGMGHGREWWPGMGTSAGRPARRDALVPAEDVVNGIDARHGVELVAQQALDLAGTALHLVPQRKDALHDGLWRGVRAARRPVRAIGEPGELLVTIALEPFVAAGPADPEPAAGLRKRVRGMRGLDRKASTFVHDGLRPSRHGASRQKRKAHVTKATVNHRPRTMCKGSASTEPRTAPNNRFMRNRWRDPAAQRPRRVALEWRERAGAASGSGPT